MASVLSQESQRNEKISLHEMIGLIVDSIMENYSTVFTAKNISLIVIAFDNMELLLNPPKDELSLPYVEGGL